MGSKVATHFGGRCGKRGKGVARRMIDLFERGIWSTRLVALAGVLASIVLGIMLFYITTVDVLHLVGTLGDYTGGALSDAQHNRLHTKIVTGAVKALDGYLLGAATLIFAFGIYELFVGEIRVIENSVIAERLLLIRSLEDLKDRLAKVVVLLLVITFFEEALSVDYKGPQDILYLAIGIALVGLSLFLGSLKLSKEH